MRKHIYIAGPFFTDEQRETIEAVERLVEGFGCFTMYRPRLDAECTHELAGVLAAGKHPDPGLRRRVFEDNVRNVRKADLLLAVVDDRDMGTVFEMGAAYAYRVPIVTYTAKNYGLNLMLANSTLAHTKGLAQLETALGMFRDGRPTGEFEERFKRANLVEGEPGGGTK